MGSTGCHREPGMSDRAFFEQEFPETLIKYGRVLDSATAGGAFYAVVANGPEASSYPNETWMLVVKINRYRGYENFVYKEMDESMGPYENDCPAKLLDLLEQRTPEPPNEYAAEWRKRCRKNANKAAKARKFATRGTVVYFPKPIEFSDGASFDRLVFQERSTFRAPDGYGRYRVTNWRKSEWSFTPYTEEA